MLRRTSRNRTASLIAFAAAIILMLPRMADAHPMGNFSVNHYTKLRFAPDQIDVEYIIDMAEIPTFQALQRFSLVPRAGDPTVARYVKEQAAALKRGLSLTAAGAPLALEAVSQQALFLPGAGGLPTMKLGVVYVARLPKALSSAPLAIHYADVNFPNRAGWKEIVAQSESGVQLAQSSVPAQDRSAELTNYPTDMLHSPPQTLAAEVRFALGPPGQQTAQRETRGWLETAAAAPLRIKLAANRLGTPRSAFTELIKSPRLDASFLLMAALIAAVLGGFHALEPGHGKTLVAAYLVGEHGKARHAVMLGGIVTASHTAAVYALGLITLYASQWVVPEQLYPWLGIFSGLLVAGLGFALFTRRYLAVESRAAHSHYGHAHAPRDEHHHDDAPPPHRHSWWGGHRHDPHGHTEVGGAHETTDRLQDTEQAQPLSLQRLAALGVTGGIVPCPAALVVLLGALAFHRVIFGLFLIVAFSVGLATVLISFGLAMVYAGRFVSRFAGDGPLIERWLPLTSSAVITMVGVALTLQSLVAAGILRA